MADNSFNNTVESLFKGMDNFITTKTVVGDAVHIGDTIILPLVDVSFGVAAGAFSQEKKNNGAGGMGGKINPSAVLVIQNGVTNIGQISFWESAFLVHEGCTSLPFPFPFFLFLEKKEKEKNRKERTKEKNKR